MSVMFEVYYRAPEDFRKEAALTARVSAFGGRLSFREVPGDGNLRVCLTYEFDDPLLAEKAANLLREEGEHVEGPVAYGPAEK